MKIYDMKINEMKLDVQIKLKSTENGSEHEIECNENEIDWTRHEMKLNL